jgi:GlpG protein
MRKIGHITDDADAKVFSDYLYAGGMENEIEGDASEGWDVWVHDEERLSEATAALTAFKEDPGDARYRMAVQAAEERRREESEAESAFQKKVYDRKRIMRRSFMSSAPITFGLIVISIAVTLLGGLGSGSPLTQWLSMTQYEIADGAYTWDESLPEVSAGQVWRLITPIFIHASILMPPFGILHILFNMMWLRELGKMLERAQGKRGLLVKVVVIAVASNLGQFAFSGPAFGGMSGVVFGLLGYCWMRGRFDLTSGLFVHSQTIIMMTAWFFLCLFGAMGSIANGAHGVGLVTGIVWGYASAHHVNSRK